jgi:hypothetical protein
MSNKQRLKRRYTLKREREERLFDICFSIEMRKFMGSLKADPYRIYGGYKGGWANV